MTFIQKEKTDHLNPPRVLVVENDAMTRHVYAELLKHWGYLPILAEGDGIYLLENAGALVRNQRCRLALVDLRLLDNFDEQDKSGLHLIPNLAPAACIILSAFATPNDFNDARQNGAYAVVHKGDGPRALRKELDKLAGKLCSQKKEIQFDPPELLNEIGPSVMGTAVAEQFYDQVLDAFIQLFPNARRLKVEKLGASQPSHNYLSAPRLRSTLLTVREDDRQPVIVKLARQQKAKIEIDNYNKYIDEKLKRAYYPALKGDCYLWDIGGLRFAYVGTLDQVFSNFFLNQSTNRIKTSLEQFFNETWSPHYEAATTREHTSLFRLYCSVWGDEWVERLKKYQGFHPEEAMDSARIAKLQPPNPFEWMKTNILGGQDVSQMEKIRVAVTHGDLHGDNMLVDSNHNIWVVDFERTQPGHILQDFIELEVDLISRLPNIPENSSAFYALCLAVCQPDRLQALKSDPRIEANAEARKVISTISTLRKLAHTRTGLTDIREYRLGLLFNTLFRATLAKNQQRALMLGSILCYRLDHPNETWPPAHWNY